MVLIYAQLLAGRYQDRLDEKAREYIGFAVEGAQRMQALIKGLRTYSQVNLQKQELRPTDSGKILDLVVKRLQGPIAETQARITHDPLPVIPADEDQLLLVFHNLVDNALKFRKDGQPPAVHVWAEPRDGEWLFRVRDNGIGIDSPYHDRVFIAFQRLHARRDKYPGTGIGLAIVKRIIERHGGRVGVESRLGEGATFFFTVPDRS